MTTPLPYLLQTTLDSSAPRSAVIISRSACNADSQPSYNLKVGEVTIRDVSLNELFDFASPRDLEVFEHDAFKREVEAKDRLASQKRLLKQQAKSTQQHSSRVSENSTSDGDVAAQSSADDRPSDNAQALPMVHGHFGRPRPTYTHLYKRGRRGRAPGGITREDHNRRQQQKETNDFGGDASVAALFNQPKRQKLSSSAASRSGSHTNPILASGMMSPDPPQPQTQTQPQSRPQAQVSLPSGLISRVPPLELSSDASSVVSSSSGSLPDQHAEAGAASAAAAKVVELMPASAPASLPASAPAREDEVMSDGGSEGSEVFEIERILEHRMSDPKTHPVELGSEAVMLYRVKWMNYEEATWEPASSFDDAMILDEYWAREEQEHELDSQE